MQTILSLIVSQHKEIHQGYSWPKAQETTD